MINEGELLFQRRGFLYRRIGMEPLDIDWAKEKAQMAKIVRNIYVFYC